MARSSKRKSRKQKPLGRTVAKRVPKHTFPCFELWLLLHFQDQTAWLDTNTAQGLLMMHDRTKGKSVNGASYMPRRAAASQRARALEKRHRGNRTQFPDDNPSSDIHRFLASVEHPSKHPD